MLTETKYTHATRKTISITEWMSEVCRLCSVVGTDYIAEFIVNSTNDGFVNPSFYWLESAEKSYKAGKTPVDFCLSWS